MQALGICKKWMFLTLFCATGLNAIGHDASQPLERKQSQIEHTTYLVEKGDKNGFINSKNQVIVSSEFDKADILSDGLAWVSKGGKWDFVDVKGGLIIQTQYDNARHSSHGLARVRLRSRWSYIEKNETTFIPFHYAYALNFFEGLAIIKEDGKTFYIEQEGKFVSKLDLPDPPIPKSGKSSGKK
jgi:hypothetical protein